MNPRWLLTVSAAIEAATGAGLVLVPELVGRLLLGSGLSDAGVAVARVAGYHALKDNGVTVKFVAYPVPGHFPGDPVRSRDVNGRWLGWLDQYLK